MAKRRTMRTLQIIKSPENSGALIINAAAYTTASSIYDDGPPDSINQHVRLNMMVTVSIPPHLRAFRYPNLTNQKNSSGKTVVSSPVISEDDRQSIASRNDWNNAASKTTALDTKRLAAQRAQRKRDEARLALAKKALAKHPHRHALQVAVENYEKKIARRTAIIRELKRRLNRLETYSSTYDITQFVTSIGWTTSTESSMIALTLGLDNSQGLFDFLPLGAKVTVWRRKATNDFNTGGSHLHSKKWHAYFITYLVEKGKEAEGRSNTMTLNCDDRLARVARMMPKKVVYSTKDKNHPNGWTPREITIDICQTNGIPYNASKIPSKAIANKNTDKNYALSDTGLTDEAKITPGSGVGGLRAGKASRFVKLPRLKSYDPGDDDKKNALVLINDCWKESVDLLKPETGVSYPIIHMRTGDLEVHFLSPPGRDVLSQLQIVGFSETNIESISYSEGLSANIVGTDRVVGAKAADGTEATYTQLLASGTYTTKHKNDNGKTIKKVVKIKEKEFNPPNKEMIWAAWGKVPNKHTFKKAFKNKQAFNVAAQRMMNKAIEPARTLKFTARAPLGLWEFDYVYVNSRQFTLRGYFPIDSINYSLESGEFKADITLRVIQKQVDQGYNYYEGARSKYNALPGAGNKHGDHEIWY